MIDDLRTVETGTAFECDLCIIGAGAAGITVARHFAGGQHSVVLLESGGLTFEPETQALYAFENVGLPRIRDTRYRYFGGTTNVWDGRCAPLSAIDFDSRPWVEYSGWPINSDDLQPFSDAAYAACGLALNAPQDQLASLLGIALPDLDGTELQPRFWQFAPEGPLRFGPAHQAELAASRNIRVLLHANAIRLQATPDGRLVQSVAIRTLDGVEGSVRARIVVLCCGGIENARVLLLSDSVASRGLGNDKDLVGRFLMDHPRRACAEIVPRDQYWFQDMFATYRHRTGARLLLGVELSPALQERQALLNCGALFFSKEDESSGTLALLRLLGRTAATPSSGELAQDVWRVMSDLDEVIVNVRRRILEPGKGMIIAPTSTIMLSDVEQAPNRESRVTLADERDALGLHRARLDWRISDQERRTMRALTTAVAQEFGRLNVARVRMDDWLLAEDSTPAYLEAHHHMGTTRMAASPNSGVVTRDCRVFGIDNLYVAGSSVFPTSGHVNPTLTIVMLSLRLAAHLSSLL